MSQDKNSREYQIRLHNARIFANALFRGEIKLVYEVHNSKNIGVYVPKNYLEDVKISQETIEETVSLKQGKQRAEGA